MQLIHKCNSQYVNFLFKALTKTIRLIVAKPCSLEGNFYGRIEITLTKRPWNKNRTYWYLDLKEFLVFLRRSAEVYQLLDNSIIKYLKK